MAIPKEKCGQFCSQHLIVAVLLVFQSSLVQAELIFSAPPRESVAEGSILYKPVASMLTAALGEKVTYVRAKTWLHYQRDMREDRFDIVFDGPHFVSWRVAQFEHKVVAKLAGYQGYVVLTEKDSSASPFTGSSNKEINTIQDLINVPVCSIAPPNLGALILLEKFSDAISPPNLISAKGGVKGVYAAYNSGKCQALVLRSKFFDKAVPEDERAKFKELYRRDDLGNQGITVSKRVTSDQILKVAKVFTEVNSGTKLLLERFAPASDKMVPASANDYIGVHKLLTGVIIGWEIAVAKN